VTNNISQHLSKQNTKLGRVVRSEVYLMASGKGGRKQSLAWRPGADTIYRFPTSWVVSMKYIDCRYPCLKTPMFGFRYKGTCHELKDADSIRSLGTIWLKM